MQNLGSKSKTKRSPLPYSKNKICFQFYRNPESCKIVLPETCFHRKLINQLTRNTVLQKYGNTENQETAFPEKQVYRNLENCFSKKPGYHKRSFTVTQETELPAIQFHRNPGNWKPSFTTHSILSIMLLR